MIPLRDSVKSQKAPYVNWILIALNIYVFIKEFLMPQDMLNSFFYSFGLVPKNIVEIFISGNIFQPEIITFVTAMFLHGGWLHLLGNMLFLWVFGDNVEDRLGHFRYLIFYIATGIIGSIAHIMADPLSVAPVIGASGAVAGVLGAYMITFPKARVLTLVPIVFFFTLAEIPAVVFLILWFVLQIFSSFASLGGGAESVAWWAHIGGFLFGIVLIKTIAPKKISWYKS
ncbi:MAG: rhomboid family intramembrane serine protease [Peptococcaceae bacterium]|nr:rhomboid family intramembrane serine protease [Peptococcaceae bacterium]